MNGPIVLRLDRQAGSSLVMAVFVLALVSSMGIALMFLTNTEVKLSQADLRGKDAFYLAEAGLEDARRTVYLANPAAELFTPQLMAAAGANLLVNFNPANVRPTYDSDGNVTGFTGYGDDVPMTATGAARPFGNGWYISFLTNDVLEPATPTIDLNRRVVLSAFGAGPDRSFEQVQAILRPAGPLPPVPPSAVTLLGPTPNFHPGTSNASLLTGNDCGDPASGLHVPVIGAVGEDAEEAVEDGADGLNPEFESGVFETTEETIVDLTDYADPLLAGSGLGPIDSEWTECQSVHDMLDDMRARADVYCPPTGSCTFPNTMQTDDIIFWDRDLAMTPGDSGQGILVVTGDFEMSGQCPWDGIIVVAGTGNVLRNGNGPGYISGTLIVADVAGPDGIYNNGDDCQNGFEVADYHVNGGGNSDVQYCSGNIQAANPVEFFKIVEFVQR